MKGFAILICLAIALVAISQIEKSRSSTNWKALLSASDKSNADFMEAVNGNKPDLIGKGLEDGSVQLLPGGQVLKGKAAQIDYFKKQPAGQFEVKLKRRDIWLVDKAAYEYGDYTYTVKSSNKSFSAHYCTVWAEQRDKSWKIRAQFDVLPSGAVG